MNSQNQKQKMEIHYNEKNQSGEKYLNNINPDMPKWAEMLIELYTSPLKYKIAYKIK